MNATLQPRLRVLLGAAATALICWKTIPGTTLDRNILTLLVRGVAQPPFFITGNGSHTTPWNLRSFSQNQIDSRQAPVIVSLGDDLEGLFQSSPPSPIDLAVIFNNFQRLGAKKAATAAVLSWDAPDPIGLMALDKAIGRFDSLVMAAPLSRGATPEPMPPAFRNASIPLNAINGDASLFPIVNRIPLAGIILGKENTMAGFQTLDSAPTRDFIPLVARWEDRLVFGFPLLVALQRLDLPLHGVEIRPGEYLNLGPNGPIVPLDRYGRLAIPLKQTATYAEIPAEALIDGGNDLFPQQAPEPVILRDDRSTAETATRNFSESLPAVVSAIASQPALAPARTFLRPHPSGEIAYLLIFVGLLTSICKFPTFERYKNFLTIAGICTAAQFIAVATANLWLPGLPALAAILAATILSHGPGEALSVPELIPISPQLLPTLPPAEAQLLPDPAAKPSPANPPPMATNPPSQVTENATTGRTARKSGKRRKKRRR